MHDLSGCVTRITREPAQFENLLGIIKNAWSQVQVDKDGKVYNDGTIS